MTRALCVVPIPVSDTTQKGEHVIRLATVSDLPSICEIEIASFRSPWPKEAFEDELRGENGSRVVVAEKGGRVIGFMIYWVVKDEIHLTNIAVHPSFRRTGLGKKMLEHLVFDGIRNARRFVFLEVRITNRAAIAFYTRYGFEKLDLRKGYYVDNNEDALIMVLELNASSEGFERSR